MSTNGYESFIAARKARQATTDRVSIRVVRSPLSEKGEILILYVDTETQSGDVLVYNVSRHQPDSGNKQQLMRRTRGANVLQVDEAIASMGIFGTRLEVVRCAMPASVNRRAARTENNSDDDDGSP